MSNFYFNYDKFYKYYINDSNLEKEDNSFNDKVWYYENAPYNNQIPEETDLSKLYIMINNKKIHIKKKGNGLLFTIPTKIGDKYWDNHYHFGKRVIVKNKIKIPVVYFHKTTQLPNDTGKHTDNCYYRQKMHIDLNIFEEIQCVQSSNKMKNVFTEKDDFVYIKEIISRPFFNQIAGKSRKIRRKNKKINHQKSVRR
jgi:hypothetical protein